MSRFKLTNTHLIIGVLIAAIVAAWLGIWFASRVARFDSDSSPRSLYAKSRTPAARDATVVSKQSARGIIAAIETGGHMTIDTLATAQAATTTLNVVVTPQTLIYQEWYTIIDPATKRASDKITPIGLADLKIGDTVDIVWSRERVDPKTGSRVLELDMVTRDQANLYWNVRPRR